MIFVQQKDDEVLIQKSILKT